MIISELTNMVGNIQAALPDGMSIGIYRIRRSFLNRLDCEYEFRIEYSKNGETFYCPFALSKRLILFETKQHILYIIQNKIAITINKAIEKAINKEERQEEYLGEW